MRMRQHINETLSYGRERSTEELKALLKARGVWFIEARLWPALRQLEDEGLVQRRIAFMPLRNVLMFRKVHPVEGAAACL